MYFYFCVNPFSGQYVVKRHEDTFYTLELGWFQWIFSSLRMRVEYRSNTHVLPRVYTHVWVIWDLRSEKQHTVNTGTKLVVNFVLIHPPINVFFLNGLLQIPFYFLCWIQKKVGIKICFEILPFLTVLVMSWWLLNLRTFRKYNLTFFETHLKSRMNERRRAKCWHFLCLKCSAFASAKYFVRILIIWGKRRQRS